MTCLFKEVFDVVNAVFNKIVSVCNVFMFAGGAVRRSVFVLMCYTGIIYLINVAVFNREILATYIDFNSVTESYGITCICIELNASAAPADFGISYGKTVAVSASYRMCTAIFKADIVNCKIVCARANRVTSCEEFNAFKYFTRITLIASEIQLSEMLFKVVNCRESVYNFRANLAEERVVVLKT